MAETNLIGLIYRFLNSAEKCDSIPQLIKLLLANIMDSVSCELIILRLGKQDDLKRYRAALYRSGRFIFQNFDPDDVPAESGVDADEVRRFPLLVPEDFWPAETCLWPGEALPDRDYRIGPAVGAAMVAPFGYGDKSAGLLVFGFGESNHPAEEDQAWYAHVAAFFGSTLTSWTALAELRERIKELSCLHGLTKLLGRSDLTLDQVLQGVAELLPHAWLYAGDASAKIEYAGHEFVNRQYRAGRHYQSAALTAGDRAVGRVEVSYVGEKPELDEGPFLAEERKLLENVARQVGQYIERQLYEAEKNEIMDKLRQADRLAMIGQVAATVAHEINEPLTLILGYAQLAAKSPDLPSQISGDINKVVATSLQVREIVRKTLLYSRRIPPKTSRLNLNDIVQETLDLFEWRCRREGVRASFHCDEQRLDIVADPGQIRQVITNLVVNSIQAMPQGGDLSLQTSRERDRVCLSVADTGPGMAAEVVDKIFIPFFSTKEAGRGAGLGLSVVHDLVSELNGDIRVNSELGSGTEIMVRFPRPQEDEPEAIRLDDQD